MNRRTFKKKTSGFTLAEILVTLMIIGVIAGVTIPSLLQSTRQKEYYTGYKKAFSVASQAFERQVADYNYKTIIARQDTNNQENFVEFSKYFSVSKQCFNNNNKECWDEKGEKLYANSQPTNDSYAFVDTSGMAWSLYSNGENILLVDMNGLKGPNEYGKDRWYLIPINEKGDREGGNGPNGKAVNMAPFNPNSENGGVVNDITTFNAGWCQHPPCKIKTALEL